MKRALVLLIAGTVLSGAAAAYAASSRSPAGPIKAELADADKPAPVN